MSKVLKEPIFDENTNVNVKEENYKYIPCNLNTKDFPTKISIIILFSLGSDD